MLLWLVCKIISCSRRCVDELGAELRDDAGISDSMALDDIEITVEDIWVERALVANASTSLCLLWSFAFRESSFSIFIGYTGGIVGIVIGRPRFQSFCFTR